MIIFFGSRITNKDFFKINKGNCPNCAQTDTLYAEAGSKYFHVFFFPFLSLGRAIGVKCTHCQRSFNYEQLPPDVKQDIDDREAVIAKKPMWHSCGCMLILLAVLIFGVATCSAWVFGNSEEEQAEEDENKPYKEMFERDLAKATTNPDEINDSLAYYVKTYMDMVIIDELDKESYKYFADVKDDRLLVIMKVTDMKKVAASERSQLITLIKEGLQLADNIEDKELFICVEGKYNTILTYTPTESDMNGRFASRNAVYDFYKPVLTKSKTLKVQKVNDSLYIEEQ